MPVWRQLLIVTLLAGVAYGGYWVYQNHIATTPAEAGEVQGPRPVTVEVARTEMRALRRTVEAVGTSRARRSVEITPLVTGRVTELAIEPGQAVPAGAVLARLDDEIERANLEEAEARIIEARQVLERISNLQSRNSASMAALEEAQARHAEAIAALDRARRRLEDRAVRAPFAGVVGLTNYDIGARVDDETVLTRLDDLSEIEVEFSLPETLFSEISAGQQVTGRSAAFAGRTFLGTVAAVDNRIDPVGRSFRVRAVMPNPQNLLPAGMFMSLEIILSESDFLVVPEEAIVVQAAEVYVFVVAGDTAERRPVETGMRRDGKVAITSGLDVGERVVIRGLQRLRDGMAVRILGDEAALAEDAARP